MNIFICYDSTNYKFARTLAVQFGMLGHDIHFEQKIIDGQAGWQQVFESIEGCDVFVFCLTRRSFNLAAQRIEYSYAYALGKPILSVLLEKVNAKKLPPELSASSMVSYSSESEVLPLLNDALENIQPANPAPEAAYSRPDFNLPLEKLRRKAHSLSKGMAEQFVLFYNLKQFLERRETFDSAREILQKMQYHPHVTDRAAEEIDCIFNDVDRLRIHRIRTRRIRQILKSVAVLAAIPVLIFFLVRGAQFIPSVLSSGGSAEASVSSNEIEAAETAPIATEEASPSSISLIDMKNLLNPSLTASTEMPPLNNGAND